MANVMTASQVEACMSGSIKLVTAIHCIQVIDKEGVPYDNKGLEAIVFTADGDMRQALNNLQVCSWMYCSI